MIEPFWPADCGPEDGTAVTGGIEPVVMSSLAAASAFIADGEGPVAAPLAFAFA
jgi:hypothetical protein